MIDFKPYQWAFTALVGILSISSLHATWQPPVVLSNPAISVSGLNGPTLSVNPQGNAVAVWADASSPLYPNDSAIVSSFYTRGIGWSPKQYISSLAPGFGQRSFYVNQEDADVQMNSSNYAIAAWEGNVSDDNIDSVIIATVRQSNGTWEPVQVLTEPTLRVLNKNPNVAVNEAGTSVVAYRTNNGASTPTEQTMVTILPFGGSWTTPLSVSSIPEESKGEGNAKPDVDINEAGDIVVVWLRQISTNFYGIDAATYNAATATWSPSVTLDSNFGVSTFNENPKTSIAENGNAVAIWRNGSLINTSSFTPGIGWSPITTLDNSGLADPEVILDAAGNATATWTHSTDLNVLGSPSQIYSAYKPVGGVWGSSEIISTGDTNTVAPFQSQEQLAVDLNGNVIAIWKSGTGSLSSAFRLFNQPWQAPEIVNNSTITGVNYESVGLASCGFAVALWQDRNAISDSNSVLAAVNENLLTPFNTSITLCTQRFASQKALLNILNWSFTDGCLFQFNIYCNGVLVGTVPADAPYQFVYPQNCKTTCNYTITSVNIFGFESDPVPFIR